MLIRLCIGFRKGICALLMDSSVWALCVLIKEISHGLLPRTGVKELIGGAWEIMNHLVC